MHFLTHPVYMSITATTFDCEVRQGLRTDHLSHKELVLMVYIDLPSRLTLHPLAHVIEFNKDFLYLYGYYIEVNKKRHFVLVNIYF